MAAFVARFERSTEPERDEYRRHSTLCVVRDPEIALRQIVGILGTATGGEPGDRNVGGTRKRDQHGPCRFAVVKVILQ